MLGCSSSQPLASPSSFPRMTLSATEGSSSFHSRPVKLNPMSRRRGAFPSLAHPVLLVVVVNVDAERSDEGQPQLVEGGRPALILELDVLESKVPAARVIVLRQHRRFDLDAHTVAHM